MPRENSGSRFTVHVLWFCVAAIALHSAACARRVPRAGEGPPPARPGFTQKGDASWYGPTFHGKDTASGERYNMLDLTAAHRWLPFDTYVRVTNLANGRKLVVRINDRGPFVHGRILDLSYTAAKILDIPEPGVMRVRIEVLSPDQGRTIYRKEAGIVKRRGVRSWSEEDFRDVASAEAGS